MNTSELKIENPLFSVLDGISVVPTKIDASHFVQFYETNTFLLDSLGGFISGGFDAGEACLVIVSKEHRQSLEDRLTAHGIDVARAYSKKQILVLDAAETLAKFMVNGFPDRTLFTSLINNLMKSSSKNGKNRTRAFGEMVALLWAAGNHQGAIKLEELWNDLHKIQSFSLFCAYPLNIFNKESYGILFSQIALQHTHIIPAESYSLIENPDEKLRMIVLLQQRAEALEAEVQGRQKLEKQKDEFISIASHELKTPITTIKSYVQILQQYFSENQKASMFLSKTNAQVDRLTELVNDLLDVSKLQSGKLEFKKEEFRLDKLVKDTVEDLQRITKSHKIIIEKSDEVEVVADKFRISQVLINLITNAIKYSPKSDMVIIRVTKDAEDVIVGIQDFGIGISTVDKNRVFAPFFQAKTRIRQSFSGLGLGLHISSQIIKRQQGEIWVESKKGKGSTFYFSLPLEAQGKINL